MKEPFKIVKTIDDSKITSQGSGSDGLVIGAVVNSPSGRTERVRVANVSDFINEYLTTDNVLASSDTTVQHVARLLNSTPVYVIRADSSKLRIGYASNKKKMYFDKDYNLLDSYTIAEINPKPKSELSEIAIVISNDSENSTGSVFYYGDASVEGDLKTLLAKYSEFDQFKITLSTPSLSEFIGTINKTYYNNSNDYISVITSSTDDIIRVNGKVIDQLGFTKFEVNNLSGTAIEANLYKFELNNEVTSDYHSLANYYVTVGGYNFFTTSEEPDVNSKVKVYPTSNWDTEDMPLGPFTVYLLDRMYQLNDIPNPTICTQKVSFTGSSVNWDILGDEANSKLVVTDNNIISNLTCDGLYKNLAISCDSGEIHYVFITRCDDPITKLSKLDPDNTYVEFDESNVVDKYQYILLDKFNGNGKSSEAELVTPALFIQLLYSWCISNPSTGSALLDNSPNFKITNNTVYYQVDVNPGISDINVVGLLTKSEVNDVNANVFTEVKHSTDSNNTDELKFSSIYIKIGKIVFYSGTLPKGVSSTNTLVKLSSKKLTIPEFISELYSSFTTYFNGGVTVTYDSLGKEHNIILVSGNNPITVNLNGNDDSDSDGSDDGIADDGNNNPLSLLNPSTYITQNRNEAKFAIVAKFPCTDDIFKFSYSKNTEDYDPDQGVYDLTLFYKNSPSSYQMSFDDTVFSGTGKSLYYENINDKYEYLKIVKLDGEDDLDKMTSKSFGSEVILPEVKASDFIDAASKFMDYEDVYYTVLWDAGAKFPAYSKYLETISGTATDDNPEYLDCIAALSISTDCKDMNSIAEYSDAIGAQTYRAIEFAPGFITDVFGGFGSKFAASTLYLEKLVANYKSISAEFDPIYGPTYGLVTAPNLMYRLNKTEREILLDHRVNSVFEGKYGQQFNFNKTCQRTKSYADEEQNVRIASAIAHVCDRYAETLIGRTNTDKLRLEVTENLYKLISDRVVAGKNKCINGIKIICDRSNNDQTVIDNQEIHIEVQVAYLRTIAYVYVYNKIKRLIE